jgi:hypothetical protein
MLYAVWLSRGKHFRYNWLDYVVWYSPIWVGENYPRLYNRLDKAHRRYSNGF